MDFSLKTHLSACDLIKHGAHIWYVRKLFQEANLYYLQFDPEQGWEIAKNHGYNYDTVAGALVRAAGMDDDRNNYGKPWSSGFHHSGNGHGCDDAYGHPNYGYELGGGFGGGDWVGWLADDYGAIGKGYGIGARGGAYDGYGKGNAYGHGHRDGRGDGYSGVNDDGNGYCSVFSNGDGYF